MTARRSPDQARVTPEVPQRGLAITPRSRKRLDMSRGRGSPLAETQNLPVSPQRSLRTPTSSKHFCPDSPPSAPSRALRYLHLL